MAYFEGALREAIHRFKYRGVQGLVHPLAQLLVEYQVSNRLPADVIVPVPLHPDREAERGYNQAGLLARALAEQVGLPIREDGLMRVRATSPQVTLNAKERQSNVAGAFRVGKGHIAGKRVLLIDDVCTTGATIEACAQALKAEGAQSAWGLTVARGR